MDGIDRPKLSGAHRLCEANEERWCEGPTKFGTSTPHEPAHKDALESNILAVETI